MSVHPLAPAPQFERASLIDVVGQSLHAPSSIPFAACGLLSQTLCYTPLALPLFYPSAFVHRLAEGNEKTLHNLAWISPALGMSLLALSARTVFDLTSNNLVKGLVYGVHSCAMGMLTNIPSGDWAGMITLRKVLGSYTQLPSALKPLYPEDLDTTDHRSELLSSAAFVTTSLALSFFGGCHLITANVIGHAAAAATKVASAHVFAAFAEKQPRTAHS